MDEQKEYFVRSFCESTQKLNAPLNATIGDCAITIREATGVYAAPEGSTLTWEYSTVTAAIGPIAALNKVERHISYLNDVLVFVQGAAIGDPRPFVAIDLDKRFDNREFAQAIFFDFPEFRSRRRLNIDNLRLFFEQHLEGYEDKQAKRRIVRALHLFRRSYLEFDPVDRFEDIWTALEAINPLIRDKYSSHRNYTVDCQGCHSPIECKKCGHPFTNVDSSAGIRYLICERLNKADQWSEIRRTRVAIVHSLKDTFEIAQEIRPKVDILRQALINGVLALVELPMDESSKFVHQPLPLSTQPEFLIRGEIFNLSVESVIQDLDDLPYFEISKTKPLNTEFLGEVMNTERGSFSLSPIGFHGQGSFEIQVLVKKGPDDEGVSDVVVRQI